MYTRVHLGSVLKTFLFLLQTPIQDFRLPITGLSDWFPLQSVQWKRAELAAFIRELAQEQQPEKKFKFPALNFRQSGF